jgi:hypothetical protein
MIVAVTDEINPSGIRVGLKQYYDAVIYELREMNSNTAFLHYHSTVGKLKPVGIQTISGLLEKDRLIFPSDYSDPRTSDFMQKLLAEMNKYKNRSLGESLRALAYSYAEMQDYMKHRLVFPRANPNTQIEKIRPEQKMTKKKAEIQKILTEQASKGNLLTLKEAEERWRMGL